MTENMMEKGKVSPKSEKNLDFIGRLETQFSDDIPQKKISQNWWNAIYPTLGRKILDGPGTTQDWLTSSGE